MKKLILSFASLLAGSLLTLHPGQALAQVSIGAPTPNASAVLDLVSGSKGLLAPRVSLASTTDATTVPSPATSLLVYNTNAALTGGTGFYYNAGTAAAPSWVRLVSSSAAAGQEYWSLTGNAGTNPATNFLGTTDNQPLAFRTNNVERLRLRTDGGLELLSDNSNQFLGQGAGQSNTTGSGNQFFGPSAGESNTTGYFNTFMGDSAGYGNTTGSLNTFIGHKSGQYNTAGVGNVFVGYLSGQANTTGVNNVFIAQRAGRANTTGNNNMFIGFDSGAQNTTGSLNVFAGFRSGFSNTTGIRNVFAGYQSGLNSTANDNTFYGHQTGFTNTTGTNNFFAGFRSGYSNTTGNYNVFNGAESGYSNTTGANNTFLGRQSGIANITGNNNYALGYQAGPTVDGLTNAGAIGYQAQVAQSNSLVLGGTGANAVNVGINTTTPTSRLDVGGALALPFITSSTTSLTLDNTHHTVRRGAATTTITLPDASTCRGRVYVIINPRSLGSFTLASAGGTVTDETTNPVTTYTGTNNFTTGTRVMLQSDGTNWTVIAN